MNISDRRPECYFAEIKANHPGALPSQWIPQDPALWKTVGTSVAVLLNESADILAVASGAGFHCFTESTDFCTYVEIEILHLEPA